MWPYGDGSGTGQPVLAPSPPLSGAFPGRRSYLPFFLTGLVAALLAHRVPDQVRPRRRVDQRERERDGHTVSVPRTRLPRTRTTPALAAPIMEP